jgi:hypothetical protein
MNMIGCRHFGNTSLAILNGAGTTVGTISTGIQTPIAIVYVK